MSTLSRFILLSVLSLFAGLLFLNFVTSASFGISEDDLKVDANGIELKELGDKKFQSKQFEEALEHYNEALKELEGDNRLESRKLASILYYHIARVYEFTNNPNKVQLSLNACSQAITNCEKYKCDDFVAPYARRAEFYVILGEYDNAIADYLHVDEKISQDPNNLNVSDHLKRRVRELIDIRDRSNRPRNLYEILEINPGASSTKEIKQAYRKLALTYHPDKHFNSNKYLKELNAQKFKTIQDAYAILSDPEKKAEYDRNYMRNRFYVK